jgi:TonB dependent receptor-like, beta-barrel/Carboxypeptidase regulatory-like domain/TonB-dependent Receptor Plug Domain
MRRQGPNVLAGLAAVFLLGFPAGLLAARPQVATGEPRGSIKGVVLDAEVRTPLAGVRVTVLGLPLEAVTDSRGRFEVTALPVGNYVLDLSLPYFRTQRVADVIVKSGRATTVEAFLDLDRSAADSREVTVTAAYFAAGEAAAPSTTEFSYEEIRRAAGAAGDVTRTISSLPSVARTNDMMNHLVVRGGSPAENAFYIDNIEVPNINHYPQQGASSGPIGLLNVEFIRDVTFSAGGFSPVYGDRLSSVMDISFREGNREGLDAQLELSMMGLGAVAEGPLPGRKGSWLVSARRSYIDLLIGLMGSGVPVRWSDFQGKAVWDLSPRNRLTFLAIGGLDDSGTHKKDALKDAESTFGELDTAEVTVGANWFHQWGSAGYSNTSLSRSKVRYHDSFRDTLSEELLRKGDNAEEAWTFRNVNLLRLGRSQRLRFGFEAKRLVSDFDSFLAGTTDVLGQPVAGATRQARVLSNLYSVFVQDIWDLVPALTLHLGLRADRYERARSYRLSPRLSFSWRPSARDVLDVSAGVFTQQLPAALLVQQDPSGAALEARSRHYIVGYRRMLSPDTRLSIEAYDKEYDRMPLDPAQPSLFLLDEIYRDDRFAEHGSLVASGRARSAGVEVLLQKKLARRLYGLASFSYFRTRYRGYDSRWYDRVYDNRILFCVEGGWKPSRSWEFGLRGQYAGGAPYTPFDVAASGTANQGIFDRDRINGARLPAYASLNARGDRRFHFRGSNLTVYLSLWNVFNHKNVAAVYWNTIDRTPGQILGWGLLPVLGLEFEF